MADGQVVDMFFNPYNQTLIWLAPDGATPFNISLADITFFTSLVTNQAISYGVQAGMTIVLFIILFLITRPEKFLNTVFILNVLSLIFIFLRSILAAVGLDDEFHNIYNIAFQYYPGGPALSSALRTSIASEIFNLLAYISIFGSLAFQIHVVCCTFPQSSRVLILLVTIVVALGTFSCRLYLTVITIKWSILNTTTVTLDQLHRISRAQSTNNIVRISAVAFFTSIFTIKLFLAILARRRLNLTTFGPMHMIFIMGCQTMIIPLIFSIVAYWGAPGTQLNTYALPIVAMFLPLSSLWASVNQTPFGSSSDSRPPPGFRSKLSAKSFYEKHLLRSNASSSAGTSDTSRTMVEYDPEKNSGAAFSPSSSTNKSCVSTVRKCSCACSDGPQSPGVVKIERSFAVDSR